MAPMFWTQHTTTEGEGQRKMPTRTVWFDVEAGQPGPSNSFGGVRRVAEMESSGEVVANSAPSMRRNRSRWTTCDRERIFHRTDDDDEKEDDDEPMVRAGHTRVPSSSVLCACTAARTAIAHVGRRLTLANRAVRGGTRRATSSESGGWWRSDASY